MEKSVMDNNECTMEDLVERIMFNAFFLTACVCMRDKVIADQKVVADIIGHRPTVENMNDFYALQKENGLSQKAMQREVDRVKLRRYILT